MVRTVELIRKEKWGSLVLLSWSNAEIGFTYLSLWEPPPFLAFHRLDFSIGVFIVWKNFFSSIMSKKCYLRTKSHFCSSGEEQAKQHMCNNRHLSWPHFFALPHGLTSTHTTPQWMFQFSMRRFSPTLISGIHFSLKWWIFPQVLLMGLKTMS